VVDHKLAATDPILLVVAWLITLVLGSILPEIVLHARLKSGGSDRTTLFFQIGGMALIRGLTWAWPTITPLRGFVWSLLATLAGYLPGPLVLPRLLLPAGSGGRASSRREACSGLGSSTRSRTL
jgi:hypothetical protein